MLNTVEFRSQFRADKFYPPKMNHQENVRRSRLVDYLLEVYKESIPTIIVEAQAGQGKTTLLKQYLDAIDTVAAWYRIGPEDTDPAFFLQSLQACIDQVVLDSPNPDINKTILKGVNLTTFDYRQQVNLLLHDLGMTCSGVMYVVLDDVHHISSDPVSIELLGYLLETAPPCIKFILSSREKLHFREDIFLSKNLSVVKLGNTDLAMNESEVIEYFSYTLNLQVSTATVKKAIQVTEGWAIGLRFYGLGLCKHSVSELPKLSLTAENAIGRDVLNYFSREVFSQLDTSFRHIFLILSLLDDITIDLAIEVTGLVDIHTHLQNFSKRNFFLRSFGSDKRSFTFHHLIRDSLRKLAMQELGAEEVQNLYDCAGKFCFDQKQPANAMRYFLQAENYDGIDRVLYEHGMSFIASNQTITLIDILSNISDGYRCRSGWSSFYLALASMDSTPMEAKPLLYEALAVFSSEGNEEGELLTISNIISIVITTSGYSAEIMELLRRADILFTRLVEILQPTMVILVCRSLALGHCLYRADMFMATTYVVHGLKLAKNRKMVNVEAALSMVTGYIHIFSGDTRKALCSLEHAALFVYRAEVGSFNKLAIRMMLFNYSFHYGDFYNYTVQKKQLFKVAGNSLVSQSIAGPFCYIWEIDIAISHGRYDEALILTDDALGQYPVFSPHILSQILQLKAIVLSFLKEKSSALECAEQSRVLRDVAGCTYFVTVNKILTGFCYCICGEKYRGLMLLEEAIAAAKKMPTDYLVVCGLLHRAAVFLDQGNLEMARVDIVMGMRLMRVNRYRHFWGWSPVYMEKIFSCSVAFGIETEYVRRLAKERLEIAIEDDGTTVPLLYFRTLVDFRIERQSSVLFDATDLTPNQREFLCLLLVAPSNSLSREVLQVHFWPDSPPESHQNKLDTLVSRLRKTLVQRIPEADLDRYIVRSKGVVRLNHVQCDFLLFLEHVKVGNSHFLAENLWQAENEYRLADRLWLGEFYPCVSSEERISALRMELIVASEELAVAWSDLLTRSNQREHAVHVIEKGLLIDPLNDRLFCLLYQLEGQTSVIRARKVEQRLELLLQNDGYSRAEISSAMFELVNSESISLICS